MGWPALSFPKKLRSLSWNIRHDVGQIPPPVPGFALRDAEAIASACDVVERMNDESPVFEKYASAESVFHDITWASMQVKAAVDRHGAIWSDELRDALRFAIEGFATDTMAKDARHELRMWMEEWIPASRRQTLVDDADKLITGWGVGDHGLRFIPSFIQAPVNDAPLVVNTNNQRDAWLYEKDCAGISHGEIIRQFRNVCKENDWPFLDEWGAIRKATTRYSKRNKLPPPPKRKRFGQ